MATDINVATIKKVYGYFVAGDVPAILDALADDVVFNEVTTAAQECDHIAHLKLLKGKEGAVQFFQLLGANQKHEIFDIQSIIGSEKDFIACVHEKAIWLPTGKSADMLALHKWEFNDEGKVAKFQSFVDTLRYVNMATP